MSYNGLWHASFTVSNLEASLEFYCGLLGLEIYHQQVQHNEYTSKLVGYPDAHLKVAMLRIPNAFVGPSGHHLELVEYVHPRGEKTDVATNRPGSPHLAFITDDIHGDFERLSASGVRFKAPAPVPIEAGVNKGGFTVYFLDPDEITLEMLQPPPGRPWGRVGDVEVAIPGRVQLTVATRKQDTFENALARQGAAFTSGGASVELRQIANPIHDHYERFVADRGLASEDADVFLCCTDWLPEAIEKGLVEPLDPFLASNPPPDWPQGWHPAMRTLLGQNGQTFGLPWHDGPEVLHYRRDLFESAQECQRFEAEAGRPLAVPRTWDEFVEVGKFFTRPDEGLWGCCQAAYTDGHNNVYDFLIQLWSRGGTLIDETGRPRFHERPGIEALQFYSDLFYKHGIAAPECLRMGSVECGDYYAQGNAAMSWNWCGFAAVCELPEYSKIVGRSACTNLPSGVGGSVSLNIYWVLTIPRGSRRKDLAYEFIRHCCTPEQDRVTSLVGANGTRLSTWNDLEVRAKYPYYEIIESVHSGTRTLPFIAKYPAVNAAISEAVDAVVHRREPVGPSLQRAAEAAALALGVGL